MIDSSPIASSLSVLISERRVKHLFALKIVSRIWFAKFCNDVKTGFAIFLDFLMFYVAPELVGL